MDAWPFRKLQKASKKKRCALLGQRRFCPLGARPLFVFPPALRHPERKLPTMKKTYVLDTNVLIQAPYALECFEDNRIVLPLAVLEELDSLKSTEGEAGRNARQAIRYLESLRLRGNLLEGVALSNGGSLHLEVNCVEVQLPKGFPDHKNDNRILKVCLGLGEKERPVILVTKDIVVRLKAQMLGIEAEDFTTEQAPVTEEQYTGRCEVYVSEKKFENFKKKPISPDNLYQVDESGEQISVALVPNQFVILRADQSVKKTQLGRFDGKHVVPLKYQRKKPYGVSPPERGPEVFAGGAAHRAGGGPLGHCQGHGGHSQDFLYPGRGPGRHAGAGGAGVPAHPHQPAQRPV